MLPCYHGGAAAQSSKQRIQSGNGPAFGCDSLPCALTWFQGMQLTCWAMKQLGLEHPALRLPQLAAQQQV